MKVRVLILALLLGAASVCPAGVIIVINAGGIIIHIGSGSTNSNPPVIKAQPVSVTASAGAQAVFVTSATGTGTLYFRWQKNGVMLQNGGRISGAHSTTLRLSNLKATDAGGYRVVVSDVGGYIVSHTATLTVF